MLTVYKNQQIRQMRTYINKKIKEAGHLHDFIICPACNAIKGTV